MNLRLIPLHCGLVYLLLPHLCALAVVVSDTTGNTTAPIDDPGWSSVGLRGSGTGVHIADGWVITAARVGAGQITLPSGTFAHDPASVVRLGNPSGSGLSPETDLVMFRLTETPALPSLAISLATPTLGTEVTMIGSGRNREAPLTHWNVTPVVGNDNDFWEEVAPPGTHSGFKTNSTRQMRWGINTVSQNNFATEAGWGDVESFKTTFDDVLGLSGEAQAVTGDSGGATFQKVGSTWVLSGIMHAVDLEDNQPQRANTAVFGNATFIADLSTYRDQVNSIMIPDSEIPTLGQWGVLFFVLLLSVAAFVLLRRQHSATFSILLALLLSSAAWHLASPAAGFV